MFSYNIKHYYIIFEILNANERHPVTSKTLASKLSLSDKTIQSSINILNDFCIKNGFQIISKSGNGFFPEIFDEKKSSKLKQNLAIYFSRNFIPKNNNTLHQVFFTAYILIKEIPLSINELCDKFYFSKSTIYSYLTNTKKQLEYAADIKLINDHEKGIYTQYNEFNKRYYISSILSDSIFQYDIDNLFETDFYLFKDESPLTKKIIQLLSKYNFSFSDEKFNLLLMYISYSNYRYQHKYYLTSDSKSSYLNNLRLLPEFDFACELTKTLNLSFSKDMLELSTIAQLVLSFNNKLIEISERRYGQVFYNGINNLFHYLNDYLSHLFYDFTKFPNYEESLKQLSYRIYFLYNSGLYFHNFGSSALNLNHPPNALIRYISRLISQKIAEYYGIRLGHRSASYVCYFCQNLLYSLQLEKSNIRLLLILKEGYTFNEYISKWLFNHLQPTPSSIDYMSLYKANIKNLNQYDLILTDYDKLDSIQSKYKVYKISDPIDQNCDFMNEYYKISNQRNITIKSLIENFKYIKIFDDCDIINTEMFLMRLDSDLDGLGNIPIHTIRKLGRPINYYGDHKTLIVPHLYNEIEKHENIMYIYFNNNKNNLKYNILVFFSLYSDYSLTSLLKIMNICNEFYVNPDIFYEIQAYISQNNIK